MTPPGSARPEPTPPEPTPAPRAPLRVQRLGVADQPVQAWRNGGGMTRQVAIDPPGASLAAGFRWRVSMAQVASDGPFSRLPGIDRSLWLLSGKGLRLQLADRDVVLDRPLQRFDFAGETAIEAQLVDGPCVDLNVMTARAALLAEARLVDLADAATIGWSAAPQRLCVVLHGAVQLADGTQARLGEALRLEGGADVLLRGVGPSRLLLVAWHARPSPSA